MARVWAGDLAGIDVADAVEAVRLHFQESTSWLLPGHVIANVKRIRQDRLPLTALESAGRECAVHVGYPLPCHRCQEEGT